jgi:hypothetical protein
MSNTAEVTPYADSGSSSLGSSLATSAAVGVGAGLVMAGGALVACAKFLSEETEQDIQAKEQYKQQRREERLAAARMSCVTLHLKDTSSVLEAAQSLGYRVVQSPVTKPHVGPAPVFMQDLAGRRLALQPVHDRIEFASNCEGVPVAQVMHRHSVQALQKHFGTKCMAVKSRQLAAGVIEFEAREASVGQEGGAATIKAQVDCDGRVHVDIDNVKGNRCEKILGEISKAVGGKASVIKKKPAYWQLPGEPAKVKV